VYVDALPPLDCSSRNNHSPERPVLRARFLAREAA
jgi:hypothetical protein